jgi:hypothetical protein
LKVLSSALLLKKRLPDVPSKKSVEKFDGNLSKTYQAQLSEFSMDEYRQMEELAEAFSVVDMLGEDEDQTPAPAKKGRKRRSESMVSDSGTEPEREVSKGRSKCGSFSSPVYHF